MALILLTAVCVLALAMALTLSGCGAADGGSAGEVDEIDQLPQVTGVTAAYTSGYVDMALTIPEGWRWEAVQSGQTEGIHFWKEDDRTLDFTLLCWREGYGICATGVSSQELILPSGLTLWQYTEQMSDGLWVNLCFEGVPGSYVLTTTGDIMPADTWEACREELLSILDTAQLGRGVMTEQQAIDAASAVYDDAYDMAYGSFNVKTGVWTVRFSTATAGSVSDVLTVTPDGTVKIGN